jgi:hypothetical protein
MQKRTSVKIWKDNFLRKYQVLLARQNFKKYGGDAVLIKKTKNALLVNLLN